MQNKPEALGPELDKQPSARFLRNGKVRNEAFYKKTRRRRVNEVKAFDGSESNIKEKLEPEDLSDASQNKVLHIPEDEDHRKLLTLLVEQRTLLQTQTCQKKRESLDDMEAPGLAHEQPENSKDRKAALGKNESEDDVPLSKLLKHDTLSKEGEGHDVEDDELLFSVLNKVKISKKRSKIIGTPRVGSEDASTADLDNAFSKASSDPEAHIITSYFPHSTPETSENCGLHSVDGDSLTIEHSIGQDSGSREIENSNLIAAPLTVEGLKVDDSISNISTKEEIISGPSESPKMSVEETERTVGKKSKGFLTTEESLARKRMPADEVLSQKNSRLLPHHKSRNMINKRINADSLNQHPMPEVACPDLTAAHEKEMVCAEELKALQEELQPIIAQRQHDDTAELTNSSIEKWIEANCKQLHTSFDRHFSIIQHFLCHSQGSCDL